ncbi:MAG: hypothetical protein ACI9HK_005247 [Pirellulaceae bacterium]|jgi:hypothetical protein
MVEPFEASLGFAASFGFAVGFVVGVELFTSSAARWSVANTLGRVES